MSIFNPTDAAKALITPDPSMLMRLEHPDGTPAGRMTIDGLTAFLVSGTALGGTAAAPTPVPTMHFLFRNASSLALRDGRTLAHR